MKAIILKYDEERHDYIVEDLDDDRHLVIKESQLQNLKIRLGKVREEEQRAGFLADWIVGPGRQAYAARRIGIRIITRSALPSSVILLRPYLWSTFPLETGQIIYGRTTLYRLEECESTLLFPPPRGSVAIQLEGHGETRRSATKPYQWGSSATIAEQPG